MRYAVERAYLEVTGKQPSFILSGWGASLTEGERAAVENRLPSEDHYREWLLQKHAPDMAEAIRQAVDALDKLGLRELVAGWNGENREDGPYEPHPAKLGVTLRTNAGTVYSLDATLTTLRTILDKLENGHG